MLKKLSNFFSNLDPKLNKLFVGIGGITSAVPLAGLLLYYFINPAAINTPIEKFLVGFGPALLVTSLVFGGYFIKEHFAQKNTASVEDPKQKENPETDLELEPDVDPELNKKIEPEIIPEVKLQEHKEELDPTKVTFDSEAKLDSEPEEVNPTTPEIDNPIPVNPETESELDLNKKIELDLEKIQLVQANEKEQQEIKKSEEPKKVTFAIPVVTVIDVDALPEKEKPTESATNQEENKDESEAVPVKVKLEPVEEPQQPVYLPQHAEQRTKTRERRAAPKINLQRNDHEGDLILPEGTKRNRNKVERFSNSRR